jgi:hypothetical protein
MTLLAQALGWTTCIIVGVLGLTVLWLVVSGKIDLSMLISEPNGGASMSRFQLLVFTFVIALGVFFALVRSTDGKFPEIPGGILALLGISGSSYLVSKGIQFSQDAGIESRPDTIIVRPVEAVLKFGATQAFGAEVVGDDDAKVTWSVVQGRGEIDARGVYVAPPAAPAGPAAPAAERAIIKAASTDGSVVAFAVVTLA